MTDPTFTTREAHQHCFTFCGDCCVCPAKDAFGVLAFIAPALPVLETMCRKAGLPIGAEKASEMNEELRRVTLAHAHLMEHPHD